MGLPWFTRKEKARVPEGYEMLPDPHPLRYKLNPAYLTADYVLEIDGPAFIRQED
jgi:hypothetical protein